MTETLEERFYRLLPALYRQRDLENGQPLRALLTVLESEFRALESDEAAAYDNWFIQTCDAWVIPYLADLVDIRDMSQGKYLFPTQRRQVANTIGYRRRKGTLPVLEHALRDVTGWLVQAVELAEGAAGTQHVGHPQSDLGRTLDLHQSAELEELNSPASRSGHTYDVHNPRSTFDGDAGRPSERQGLYSLNQIGLLIWRLRSYYLKNNFAHAVGKAKSGEPARYTFDPLGREIPLFNLPQMITDINQRAEDIHMPLRLSREALAADLKAYEEQYGDRPPEEQPQNSAYYGLGRGLNVIVPDGTPTGKNIPPIAVVSMDLSQWPTENVFPAQDPDRKLEKLVAIDVHLGRLALLAPCVLFLFSVDSKFAAELNNFQLTNVVRQEFQNRGIRLTDKARIKVQKEGAQWAIDDAGRQYLIRNEKQGNEKQTLNVYLQAGKEIKVDYCYGLSDEIGGGPYRRSAPLKGDFRLDIAKGTEFHTLEQALKEWEEYCQSTTNPSGLIRILDNGVYGGNITVRLPTGARLMIIADNGVRPTIRPIGNVNVICAEVKPTNELAEETEYDLATPGRIMPESTADREKKVESQGVSPDREFFLGGMLVSGGIHIGEEGQPLETEKLTVTIVHCTLMPNGIRATLNSTQRHRQHHPRPEMPNGIQVTLNEINAKGLEINIDHCIVGPLHLPATVGSLTVTDSIVDHVGRGAGYAVAADNQGAAGPAVKFERVTVFGQVAAAQVTAYDVIFTGRVIAPQPATLDQQVQFSYVPEDSVTPEGKPYQPSSKRIEPPVFVSRRFGDPTYAQLSDDCPLDIRGGASDGSEMGVFHELHSLQAEANIPSVLDEYLPAGLQASVFYMT